MTTALYSGSFDPVTFGHLDVIGRAAGLFDRLIVAVGVHHSKSALLQPEEKLELLRSSTRGLVTRAGAPIEIIGFDGLLVTAAEAHGARVLVRGLRNATDFDYEVQMAGMNGAMAQHLEVVYLAAAPSVRHIASSLVRQVAALGGPLDAFVPPEVAARLKAKFAR